MKVILNFKCDFASMELDAIPRIGEKVFYGDDEDEYVIYDVEWCLDLRAPHVNLMLNKVSV